MYALPFQEYRQEVARLGVECICTTAGDFELFFKLMRTVQHLEIAAHESHNTQRRLSVLKLIEMADCTEALLTLKSIGADYTLPARNPLLTVDNQRQSLELHRFKINTTSDWRETVAIIQKLSKRQHLFLRDIDVHPSLVVMMYRSLLTDNKTLPKLTVRSVPGHPSFINSAASIALRHIFGAPIALEEVSFESNVIERTQGNSGEFLDGHFSITGLWQALPSHTAQSMFQVL